MVRYGAVPKISNALCSDHNAILRSAERTNSRLKSLFFFFFDTSSFKQQEQHPDR